MFRISQKCLSIRSIEQLSPCSLITALIRQAQCSAVKCLFQIDLEIQVNYAVMMFLCYVHTVKSGAGECQKAYIPPDSRIRKARTPVPSEHAMRLPQIRKAAHGVGTAFDRLFLVGLLNVSGG